MGKRNSGNRSSSRYLGLGTAPPSQGGQAQGLGAALKCPWQSVPVIEHVTWTTNLPLKDEDILATFGDTIDPMQNPKSVPGILDVDSSFIINGLLQLNMICYGVGIHIFGEPFSFTAEGNSILATATSPIASLDSFTSHDVTNDAMGQTEAAAGTPVPALLEWGFADWMAAWHLANAYEVNWWFNQRYTLIKEMLADFSYFGPFADSVGSGTSQVAAQQFFAQVNARYRGLASPSIIQPINFRRLGSVNTASTNNAVSRVTRDFDLVDVTYGGLRNQGNVAQGSPWRKFMTPVFIEKGIPIGLMLQAQDAYHQAQMQRYLSITEMGATTPALVKFDSAIGGTTVSGASVALEQTQDSPPNLVAQTTNTDRALYKGGAFKVSFQIKGFEVDGDWLPDVQSAMQSGAIANGNSTQGLARV